MARREYKITTFKIIPLVLLTIACGGTVRKGEKERIENSVN